MQRKSDLLRWTTRTATLFGMLTACLLAGAAAPTPAQAAPFTYQGQITENGLPSAGPVDLRFRIYTSQNGDIVLDTVYVDDVALDEGRFTAQLTYGQIFLVPDRWIAIGVRPGDVSNGDRSEASYTELSPRQQITPTPYSFLADRARELKLPVDQSENIAGAAVRIRNDVGVAISANSSEYVGLSASTESGTAIVAQSTTGWAGNFIGPLHTSARLAINYASPTTFKIACNGDAAKPGGGSWSVLSDARLKRNIQPLHGALDRVLGLRGVTFEYTDEAAERGLALPGEQIGLIAQEVEKVFPDWVGQDEDGTKYVTEHGTTALFVEALRELRNEKGLGGAEALEQLGRQAAEIEELKRQVAELKQMLGQAAR